jgi:hypothetical protein
LSIQVIVCIRKSIQAGTPGCQRGNDGRERRRGCICEEVNSIRPCASPQRFAAGGVRADFSSHGERRGSVTPQGSHVRPARTEPRFSRCHEFHHFAGGLPAAAFVGERTFRWRRVGSLPCVYIHDPLPRRDLSAALLPLEAPAVQCDRIRLSGCIIPTFTVEVHKICRRAQAQLALVLFVGIVLPVGRASLTRRGGWSRQARRDPTI